MNETTPAAPAAKKYYRCTPEQKIARLKQELAQTEAQEAENIRRADMTSKVLLGAAVLATGDSKLIEELTLRLRPIDRTRLEVALKKRQRRL